MNKNFSQTIFILCLLLSLNTKTSFAINWKVGVPVDTIVTHNALGYSALGGCFPSSPDVTWTFAMPNVSGIQFSLVVTSVDPLSAYLLPGPDTLAVGDTIHLVNGANFKSLYYFATNPSPTPIRFDLIAKGTPTVAGEFYPCNVTAINWISNLGFCPDGLSGAIPATCKVDSATVIPASISDWNPIETHLIYPSQMNHFQMMIPAFDAPSSVSLFTMQGQQLYTVKTEANQTKFIDCSLFPNGIYILKIESKHQTKNIKFSLQR